MSSPAHHGTFRTGWFKSSYSSSTGSCVEVRFDGGQVAVRDSKNLRAPAGPGLPDSTLTLSSAQWAAFLGNLEA